MLPDERPVVIQGGGIADDRIARDAEAHHPAEEGELPDTLQSDKAAYQLVNVGGWLHTHAEADQRRRKLWMVEAGSLVIAKDGAQGSLEDVQPNYENEAGDLSHHVWRYGFALPIGGLTEVK